MRMKGRPTMAFMVVLIMSNSVLATAAYAEATSIQEIAERRYAVHHKGLQWLGMSNEGVFVPTPGESLWVPELEYPGGSGTVFLYSGGLWVGALKDGRAIVSGASDFDNGTNEFGQLEYGTVDDMANEEIRSIGWLEKSSDRVTAEDQENAKKEGRYLGMGVLGVDDDNDGRVDEDPAGDISNDFIDNDGDGLVDSADPDLDGDQVPGSLDDDGDGLEDEDDSARAAQELITAYVDTCADCLEAEDGDGFKPLGIRVVQHSYQWIEPYADDFLVMRYDISNIGADLLEEVCFGMFFDFDVGHMSQTGSERCEDDYAYYYDDLKIAVGADNDGDEGLLSSLAFGVRFIETPVSDPQTSYLNFNRLSGGEPIDDLAKYMMMSCGRRYGDKKEEADWRMILAIGPLGDLAPGETMGATIAIVNGFDDEHLRYASIMAEKMLDPEFKGPTAPEAPIFLSQAGNKQVTIKWKNNAETALDPALGSVDFQGYNIWRTGDGETWTLVSTYDLPDTLGLNAGWPPPESLDEDYNYEVVDEGLMNGARLSYVVTAFDNGHNGDGIHPEPWDQQHSCVGVLESSREEEFWLTVIPAASTQAEGVLDSVYVVPNPYMGSSRLEGYGRDGERSRQIDFRGLPPVCEIAIYTLAGDFVQELFHTNGLSWESWDLRNEEGREVAGGIYLYRIGSEGNERIGKFVVVK